MTTTNATALTYFAGTRPSYGSPGVFGIVKLHCNMATIASDLGIVVNAGGTDTLNLWDVPIGTMVLGALLDVTKAEGAACTCSIGDDTNAASLIAAGSDLNAVAKIGTTAAQANHLQNKVFAAGDTIDIVFATDTDIDTAVFDIYLYCLFNQDVWAET